MLKSELWWVDINPWWFLKIHQTMIITMIVNSLFWRFISRSCSKFLPVKGEFFLATVAGWGQALGCYKAPGDHFDCNKLHINKDELNWKFQRQNSSQTHFELPLILLQMQRLEKSQSLLALIYSPSISHSKLRQAGTSHKMQRYPAAKASNKCSNDLI